MDEKLQKMSTNMVQAAKLMDENKAHGLTDAIWRYCKENLCYAETNQT